MIPPLIILCAGRSFSSVVCSMLGQHPDVFATPELNLFVTDTVGEMVDQAERTNRLYSLHGLIRTLAEAHDGEQTETSVDNAWDWMHDHREWSTRKMFRYIGEQVAPRILTDKSPTTAGRMDNLIRLYRTASNVRILHLSRHPIAVGKSLYRVKSAKAVFGRDPTLTADPTLIETHWTRVQKNIMRFTDRLRPAQSMRLRGELLMEDPDTYLRQICQWLGIDDGTKAIEAMRHPEKNSFAHLGPRNARYGNNADFLRNPNLRIGRPAEVFLTESLPWLLDEASLKPETIAVAQRLGYR